MSEGTALRERLRQIAWDATTGVPIDPEHIDAIVDGFLAALQEAGALAPAALTDDERGRVEQEAWKEWQRERDRFELNYGEGRWAHDHQMQYDMLMNALDRALAPAADAATGETS